MLAFGRTLLVATVMLVMMGLAAAIAAQSEDVSGWPRQIVTDEATIVIYQPQPERLVDDELEARAAVSVALAGQPAPALGVAWFKTRLSTNREPRVVDFLDIEVTRSKFPDATAEEREAFARLVEEQMASWQLSVSLDRLLPTLEILKQTSVEEEELQHDPPAVLVVNRATALVTIDGEPRLVPVEDSPLEQVINTLAGLVFDPRTRNYYLYGGQGWYTASKLTGPWMLADTVPPEVTVLAERAEAQTSGEGEEKPPEQVVVVTEPTELITIEGSPIYLGLGEGGLQYVANCDAELLRGRSGKAYYVLLSGRWFQAPTLSGPWKHLPPDRLPASFAQIPPDSAKGYLLAQVPGTPQAADAVAELSVPQTTAVERADASLEVPYDGTPRFEPIPGTQLEYAVNTPIPVLRSAGRYYACEQGVWYVAETPEGPWQVADHRPDEVDDLPPESPIYRVRYVNIYDSTPEYVYVGYTPGYLGSYPYQGTVVYGTGYRYPGWAGSVYYPSPWTWGVRANYNPRSGGWYFSNSLSPSWYRSPSSWRGGYTYSARVWGPTGYQRVTYRSYPTQPTGGYRVYQGRSAELGAPSTRVAAQAPPGIRNDVLADAQGNLYRRAPTGWQAYQGRAWVPVQYGSPPPPFPGESTYRGRAVVPRLRPGDAARLDAAYSARMRGMRR